MARILVLDGHCSAALAFARSLGRAGHWVAVGEAIDATPLASYSRFCRRTLKYRSPLQEIGGFVDDVCCFAEVNGIDLLMPCTEATLWPVSRFRARLGRIAKLGVPGHDCVEMATDKAQTAFIARKNGIRVPESALVRNSTDQDPFSPEDGATVIKSCRSLEWNGTRATGFPVDFAFSRGQFRKIVARRLAVEEVVIAQKFITGVGVGMGGFAASGELRSPFQWVRVREKDPRGSGSSARKSVPLSDPLVNAARRIVRDLDFTGLIMVEFKQQGEDFFFMEVNARPWGSIQLPVHCGVDYPRMCADWYLDGTLPPEITPYRSGILCRCLAAELSHLECVWEGKPEGWPGPFPRLIPTAIHIAVPWRPGMRYDHLDFRDLKPGIQELTHWLQAKIARR